MNVPHNPNDYTAIVAADKANVWHHLTQHKKFETTDPLIIVEGKGMRVWNQAGREHLDAVSGGVWTVNVGYGREIIANAVRDQLVKMNYFAGAMGTIPGALFAERLIEKMPGMSRVYYSNSGSEANEKGLQDRPPDRPQQIWRQESTRSFIATVTITARRSPRLASGGHDQRKEQYGPFPWALSKCRIASNTVRNGARCDDYGIRAANAIEEVILREGPDTVGGIILEPITAGGGVITPPKGYWERVQEICKKYDILLIIDEVVCGMGRTGTWFGYQQYGIQPDMVTMAKGVASGYAAISCTVTTEEVFNMFKADPDDPMSYFRDISTFGGCTAGPAAALENMNILESEKLLENSAAMGDYMLGKLEELKGKHPMIGEVRGKGLFCGVELVADRETKEPVHETVAQAVVGNCMANDAVVIGVTNRSLHGFNNTLTLQPVADRNEIRDR